MKLSYSWLKNYLECDLTPQQVADAMTSIGIEVDSVAEEEEIPGGLAGVVVAEVVECEAHPNSDHLHITRSMMVQANSLQLSVEPLMWQPARKFSLQGLEQSSRETSKSRSPRSAESSLSV